MHEPLSILDIHNNNNNYDNNDEYDNDDDNNNNDDDIRHGLSSSIRINLLTNLEWRNFVNNGDANSVTSN